MTVILKNKTGSYNATGEYDPSTNALLVKAGSIVSSDIRYSSSFRGAKSIERQREQYVVNSIVQQDVSFMSPSTAANFITGRSCNGMIMWKNEEGKTIKKAISA